MIDIFRQLFSSGQPRQALEVQEPKVATLEAPRYPPTDRGLPLTSIAEVMDSQKDIITRIQRTAGLAPETYASLMLPIISNFARYVLLLPATNTMNHRGAGGLFRMGLELGLFSLQAASSTTFTSKGNTSSESRYRNTPKWIFATFVAAICSEIYRPISNMVVVDDDGKKWPQLLTPLHDWLTANKKNRYYIIWNAQNEDEVGFQQANAAFLLTTIVPPSCLQYLNDGDTDIMLAMTNCVTGAQGGNNQISRIVTSIRQKIVQTDMTSNSERYGMQVVGAHLEPHLLDAMRRLYKDGTWSINTKGARIWFSENEGLFVVWQTAAREMLKLLEKDGKIGIPQDADTLADILIACGAAVTTEDGERYWAIQIPVTMQLLNAVRISHPEILLQNSDVEPSAYRLLSGAQIQEEAPENKAIVEKKVDKTRKSAKSGQPSGELASNVVDIETGEILPESSSGSSGSELEPAEAPLVAAPEGSHGVVVNSTIEDAPIPAPSAQGQESRLEEAGKAEISAPKPTVQRMSASTIKSPAAQAPKPPKTSKPVKPALFTPRAAGVVKEKVVVLGSRADELFGALKADSREFLQAILTDYKNTSSTGPVFSIPQGFAISTDELNSHGQVIFTGLLQALSNKHWLWEDTENFPNGKKLHEVEHLGQLIKVMVILPDIARELGFDWKGTGR